MNRYRRLNMDRRLEQDEWFRDFYNAVGEQASVRIPRFDYGERIESKDLLDPEFWGQDHALHRLIGQVVAHQVTHGRLRLKFVSCALCTCKVYERI